MRRILPFLRDNRGLQTLEWVALGLVILGLMAAVAFYFTYRASESTGRAVGETIQALFDCVERLDFDCMREVFQTPDQPQRPRWDPWWCITNPLECWTEVIWPGIRRTAQQIWRWIETIGESIYRELEAAWRWIQQQWNTWLKGALAGLLAGLLLIAAIAVLFTLGIIKVLTVAIIAGLVALVVAIIAGAYAQWKDPQGGFLRYFTTALTSGATAVGLVIGGIKFGILKLLKGGIIPTVISVIVDMFWNFHDLDQRGLLPWLQERFVNAAFTYLTSMATYGFAQGLEGVKGILKVYKSALQAGSLFAKAKTVFSAITKPVANVAAIVLINFSMMYLSGVITGDMPGAKEYTVTGVVTLVTLIIFKVFPVSEIIESVTQEILTKYLTKGPPKILSNLLKNK
ncbi:hypothetical protein [Thermoflexus sp.]|uniref:hypothetical protein n=2 Tax=Thermoflexus sp. TaxID=1969742 RepID=UPI00260DCA91|nr:hypothetical protein [Thermoflexus sp.]MCX7691247.1 hypothetical protein [Thermoflexus sp.]